MTSRGPTDGEQILARVARHTGTWNAPPAAVPTTAMPDGPLLGNGDLGVVVAGPADALRCHLGKNDFWTRTHGDASIITVGTLCWECPALPGATYRLEQHLAEATVTGQFQCDSGTLTVRAWVAARANILVVELAWTGDQPLATTLRYVPGTWPAADPAAARAPATGACHQAGSGWSPPWHSDPDHDSTAAHACLWAQRRADDLPGAPRRVAVVARVLGAAALPAGPEHLALSLDSGARVTVAAVVLSDLDDSDCLAAAWRQAAALDADRLTAHAAAHRRWWRDFWQRSGLELDDAVLERHWYGALYVLGSCSRPGKVAPGLWGNWVTTDRPNWHGDFHLNYNFQAPYYLAYASGHADLALPFYQAMAEARPQAERMAARHGWSGLHFPVCIGPWGLSPEDPDQDWGQRSNAAYAALLFVWHWHYTRDQAFLETQAYPFVRDVAAFWEGYLTPEKGRYVVRGDAIHEGSGEDTNPILSLGLLRALLAAALEMSAALGCDADRRVTWGRLLSHLGPFPQQQRAGVTVFRYSETGMGWCDSNTLGIQHIFPAGAIGLDADPQLLGLCHRTIEAMARWSDFNGLSSWYTACARVGYDPDTLLARLRQECQQQARANLLLYYGGGGIESVGGFLALCEMMLQSHDGMLRLFPCWPADRPARFWQLRARGAFRVSAAWQQGRVADLNLHSEQGQGCSLVNPWPGQAVQIRRADAPPTVITGPLLRFATTAGETLELGPAPADRKEPSLDHPMAAARIGTAAARRPLLPEPRPAALPEDQLHAPGADA